jgi:hypothetical protein
MNLKLLSTIATAAALQAGISNAQTITFTANDPANWSDGIAQDGEGGSSDIPGITLQMYAANTAYAPIASGIEWHNNSYLNSGQASFNAITPVPDASVQGEVPAFVIKSSTQSVNFNLSAIQIYDWGGSNGQKMEAFDNGISKGFITLSFDQVGWNPSALTQPTALPVSIFGNIDEIRITAANPVDGMYPSINNIVLGSTPLALRFTSFNASLNTDHSATLVWHVADMKDVQDFSIEQSADGKSFREIGKIRNIPTDVTTFRFTTESLSQDAYFRIKETDYTGSSVYSKIERVMLSSGKNIVTIAPNPAQDELTIRSRAKISHCTVMDITGKIMLDYDPQESITTLDVSFLQAGFYFLRVSSGSESQSLRFVKK